jgi:cytochrome c oxidase cbb3-type subunit I
MTVWIFVTYARSRRREEADPLYPSQWFILASLFWFAWIYSTAILLLQFFPVRGVVQASVAWWFAGNLLNVWLGLAGLAATLYLLPKLVEKPLQSNYLALFAFLTLVLFGTWTGIPAHVALPAWMPALSSAANLLFLLPVFSVVTILLATIRGTKVSCMGGPLCFTKFGVWSFALAGGLLALTACPQINRITDFTWFNNGRNALGIYGFFAMTMFAAVYHIFPKITGIAICPNRVRAHFGLSIAGVILFALPLLIAGVLQGFKLVGGEAPFANVVKASMMPFRVSTLGETLLLVGNVLFLFNIISAMLGYYLARAKAAYAGATAQLEPAEVKP